MRWAFATFVALLLVLTVYMSFRKKSPIPQTIWTYWHDSGKIPAVVQKCIDTWQANNPNYRIVVLDNTKVKKMFGSSLKEMLPHVDLEKLNSEGNHQRAADYARVLALCRFGGIWMDSSIICTSSLEWVQKAHTRTGAELVGFYAPHTTNKSFPILENWFFSCPPNSAFVQDWLDEIRFMSSFRSESDYVEHVKRLGTIDMQDLEKSLPYLVMHLCATVVQQKNPWKYNLHITDSMKGPFRYLEARGWKLPDSFEALCSDASLQTPIVKMRGTERIYLENHPVGCPSQNRHIRYVINSSPS